MEVFLKKYNGKNKNEIIKYSRIGAICFTCLFCFLFRSYIIVNNGKSFYLGQNYKSVEADLKRMGFTHINCSVNPNEAGTTFEERNSILDITIDGKSFENGDKFTSKSVVNITYCGNYDLYAPEDSSNFKGLLFTDVEKQFRTAGFSNIKTEGLRDKGFLNILTTDKAVESVTINGQSFDKGNHYKALNALVHIRYHSPNE